MGWKDRASPVAASGWKSRAKPIEPGLEDALAATLGAAGDVLSLGYAPQIKAGVSKGISTVTPFTSQQVLAALDKPITEVVSGQAFEGLPEEDMDYVALRDEAIKRAKEVEDKDPTGAALGTGLGIASTMGLGGAPSLAKGLPAIAKQLSRSALTSGAIAGAYNPGDIEGEVAPLQLDARGDNALTGAAFGAAGTALPIVASKVAPALQSGAQSLAVRALGRGTKRVKEALGEKGLQKLGQEALDAGIITARPSTINQIAKRVEDMKTKIGTKIGSVIDEVDDLEKSAVSQGASSFGLNKQDIAAKVRAELIDPDTFPSPEYINKVEKRIDSFLATGQDKVILPTKGAHTIKQKLGADMKRKGAWDRIKLNNASEEDVINRTFYDALGDSVLDSANATAALTGNRALENTLQGLNKSYSAAKNMERFVKDEVARGNTNRMFDLYSMIGGAAAGGATQDPVTGLATAAILSGGRRFGPQIGAKALQAGSKLAGGVGGVGPVQSGLIASQFMGRAIESKDYTPTAGAKLLQLDVYEKSADLESVPVEQSGAIVSDVMKSDLTNVEKAKVIHTLKKDGRISARVLNYLGGSQ